MIEEDDNPVAEVCGKCHKPKGKGEGYCECGRPLKFKTVDELEIKIDEYFKSCWGKKIGSFGPIKDKDTDEWVLEQIKPYTISGLAAYLGVDRVTLLNYAKRDEFFSTIKKAKSFCEAYAEEMLFKGKNAAGPIFNLKNNYEGWKDVKEVKQTNFDGNLSKEKEAEIDEALNQNVVETAKPNQPSSEDIRRFNDAAVS